MLVRGDGSHDSHGISFQNKTGTYVHELYEMCTTDGGLKRRSGSKATAGVDQVRVRASMHGIFTAIVLTTVEKPICMRAHLHVFTQFQIFIIGW